VGLTAVMTLVAGTPHFDCLCPNGHVKPFSLNLFAGPSPCCDRSRPPQDGEDGSCGRAEVCRAAGPARPSHSCCHARRREEGKQPHAPQGLRNEGCKKVLVEAEPATPGSPLTAPGPDLSSTLLAVLPEPSPDLLGSPAGRPQLKDHHGPPPTDLITILQHFLL
jgi:hypothetical protein